MAYVPYSRNNFMYDRAFSTDAGKTQKFEESASLSRNVHNYIRRDMKFSGVIISDGLAMKGVTDFVGGDRGTAAVRAVQAGNDMLCVTGNYTRCYNALVSAAKKGAISESQIDASVKRILKMKIRRGIIYKVKLRLSGLFFREELINFEDSDFICSNAARAGNSA